ncbi:glycoside hydrolase family 72 protein [Mycena rosella]|uniref:1,3-beta-glucanosyltransferase n=1 Tax=Mycena rosella TaxID=1033263 RepID=A0AAD7GEE8_MYCRO|nr:glycoside hydrolase family 72 protein [Mycena rosella]
MRFSASAAVSTCLLALVTSVAAISKVTRTGRYLYTDDGSRFYIKGVTYQTQGIIVPGPDNPLNQPSTFVDNLADDAGCTRDLPNLKTLGINTIRAYSVDSTLNHDSCMKALSAAGIYVIMDLTLPLNGSIDTTQPMWSTNILDQYIKTIDVFKQYDNVLAYNIGNEVLTSNHTQAAPFLKAAARDIKAYLTSISSSALIGYADIDGASAFRDDIAEYLSCDPSGSNSASSAIDLFGLNSYAWCGDAVSTTYDILNSEFQNYNVVAYFSEYGSENCNPGTRVWTETDVMFASPMTNVWSGGLAFNYFHDLSNAAGTVRDFGLVTLSSDNSTATPNADFTNLAAQYGKVTFANNPTQASAPASSFSACPSSDANFAASAVLPPTPNESACACLASKLPCLFTPKTSDFNAAMGDLTNTVCSFLLPNEKGSCADIAADGTAGTYGLVAMCDPTIRLSYAFSQYYELTARASTSCDFSGNATLNAAVASAAPSAATAAASCISSPSAVFTPSAPAGGSAASGGSGSGSSAGASGSGTSGAKNGAVALVGERGALVGMAAAVGCGLLGMLWTLA